MENTKRTKHLVLSFNNKNKIKSIKVYNPATTAAIFSVFNENRDLLFEKRIKRFGVDLFEDVFVISDLDFQSLVFESRTDDSSRILIDKIDSSTIFFEDSYGLEFGFKVNEEKCVLYDLQYNEHDFIKTNL